MYFFDSLGASAAKANYFIVFERAVFLVVLYPFPSFLMRAGLRADYSRFGVESVWKDHECFAVLGYQPNGPHRAGFAVWGLGEGFGSMI